jgi:hypothetical protein
MLVVYTPNWMKGASATGHFEFSHKPARRIPVSLTGYRSHFAPIGEIEAEVSPQDYVRQYALACLRPSSPANAERSRRSRRCSACSAERQGSHTAATQFSQDYHNLGKLRDFAADKAIKGRSVVVRHIALLHPIAKLLLRKTPAWPRRLRRCRGSRTRPARFVPKSMRLSRSDPVRPFVSLMPSVTRAGGWSAINPDPIIAPPASTRWLHRPNVKPEGTLSAPVSCAPRERRRDPAVIASSTTAHKASRRVIKASGETSFSAARVETKDELRNSTKAGGPNR